MNIKEKNKIITQYLYDTFDDLKNLYPKATNFFEIEEKYKKALDEFLNRDEDINTLKELIDIEKQMLIDSYKEWEKQESANFLSQFQTELEENERLGITLNRQMIELLMIVKANSIDELNKIAAELFIEVDNVNVNVDLNQLKESMFNKYVSSLIDRNEWHKNPNLTLAPKLSNVINNVDLTTDQLITLKKTIENGLKLGISSHEVFKNIASHFPKEISHNIFVALSESRDLSEPGIKELQMSDCQLLYNKLKEFKSITIDFEVKYPALLLGNGELYFKKLERCLDFARILHKDVRLNALIFFEDCPKHLRELEYNDSNKQKVYNELLKYVDKTTKMIASYNEMSLKDSGYEVIKSIDVFNELITRFAKDFNGQYFNREDISKDNSKESGWQKFLSIEDLCEIALIARRNLPNVEFVYNETNLEDKNKLDIFKSIIDRVKNFEEKNKGLLNGKKLIDCLGTQMHLEPNVTEKEIDASLSIISSYGYPIKITEYDQPLPAEYINSHTEKECEEEKERRQKNLKNFIVKNATKYNLKQVTIWSLTDSTSFLLDKQNKALIKLGKKPIKNNYAGVFRVKKKKSFDNRTSDEIQEYEKIKDKNQNIKQDKQKTKEENPKVKVLSNKNSVVSQNGFVNLLILTSIIAFFAGALFIIIYMIVGR